MWGARGQRMDKELAQKSTGTVAKAKGRKSSKVTGLRVPRYFTTAGVDPADELAWEYRTASISGEDGKAVFEQKNVEVPKSWSMLATNVVASKYFRGTPGTPERETSVRKLVARVVDTHPQCSACFINSVEDSMESILGLAKTEGMLFKYGSGTGSNLSTIRSSKELLAGGGTASGPVSFMKGFDAFAGVIKSGGKTRRAAKMVILNSDHPDVLEFIRCKATEEKKAWALIDAGYDGSFNGEAYASVFFQNSNNSVRVTDEFMNAVIEDKPWTTRAVRDGHPMETYPARELFREIAEAAWLCGDPGLQFDTTVNGWHTCPNTARINASNPCSEYMFLDDSACNLASLNLMHFRTIDGEFDAESFKHAVNTVLLAQEILVDYSKYPTQKIAESSFAYRPLGLGYANLGALLMASGLPYNSPEGRNFAAAITALMHGQANLQSSRIAERMGPFAGYARNAEPMLGVMRRHRKAAYQVPEEGVAENLRKASREVWDAVLTSGEENGFRNGQVTVLAPTGTIGFMMDCDTTGIKPDIALIKYKKLVGGGMLKIVNTTVPLAVQKLGYTQRQVEDIVAFRDKHETNEGAPHLKDEHLPVFDCAFKPAKGSRSIHWMGHIQMMGAVQPFLSGAISKTVNMPTDASVEEIEKAYLEAWRQGLKAIAVYRDGCKRSQPLNTSRSSEPVKEPVAQYRTERRRLPDERQSITHKFSIGGHEGYLTVGMYEDGTPGELFVVMAKEGSVVSGLMDSFATAISLSLQYGVPLKVLVDKFSHTRFEPSGFTGNPNIPIAKSITDYIFRWLSLKFLPSEDVPESFRQDVAVLPAEARPAPKSAEKPSSAKSAATWLNQQDA